MFALNHDRWWGEGFLSKISWYFYVFLLVLTIPRNKKAKHPWLSIDTPWFCIFHVFQPFQPQERWHLHRSQLSFTTYSNYQSVNSKLNFVSIWATFKTLMTFHYTDWLIGVRFKWLIIILMQLGTIIPYIQQISKVSVTAYLTLLLLDFPPMEIYSKTIRVHEKTPSDFTHWQHLLELEGHSTILSDTYSVEKNHRQNSNQLFENNHLIKGGMF